jgi:acyl-CoA reductase-like NAD-dependent aldehyde dehydrogenase
MVSFTGSLEAGKRIASVAGQGIKKVCLELGGKSAFVVLEDAPFEKAVPAGVNNCMQNSGQTCSAWTVWCRAGVTTRPWRWRGRSWRS